jgi:hypothetical protein
MADGKTNPEIAAALGITLDGAKWNVSEILTKLGFSSREEAAEYWRIRQRWTRRLVRLLTFPFSPSLLKPILVISFTGATLFIVAMVWTISRDREDSIGITFYLEAIKTQRREGSQFQLDSTVDLIRIKWWYKDDDHFRQETFVTHGEILVTHDVVIADGLHVAYPSDNVGYYDEYPIYCREIDPSRLFAGGYLGRVNDRSIDALLERIRTIPGPVATWARLGGADRVLGYDVSVIEYGPTWLNSQSNTSGGVGRIWIDPTRMFVLRSTAEGNDGSEAMRIEATKLEFDASGPSSLFEISLPDGTQATVGSCDLAP